MPYQSSQRSFSRSRGGRTGFKKRQRYEWRSVAANLSTTGLSTGQQVLLTHTDLDDLTEPTLVRTRGSLLLSVPALSGTVQFILALMVVQLDELGNPPAVNAFDQELASYFWVHFGALVDFGGGNRFYRVEVDSKAMRRIEGDEGVVAFVQQISGPEVVTYNLQLRILFRQV